MKIKLTTKVTINSIDGLQDALTALNITKEELKEVIEQQNHDCNKVLDGIADAINSGLVNQLEAVHGTSNISFDTYGYIAEAEIVGVTFTEISEFIYNK